MKEHTLRRITVAVFFAPFLVSCQYCYELQTEMAPQMIAGKPWTPAMQAFWFRYTQTNSVMMVSLALLIVLHFWKSGSRSRAADLVRYLYFGLLEGLTIAVATYTYGISVVFTTTTAEWFSYFLVSWGLYIGHLQSHELYRLLPKN